MSELFSTLIHDLSAAQITALLPDKAGYQIIDANANAAFCQGCFGCWLKTPGICVMKDRLQTISAKIGHCKEMVILSRCCYGDFSPGVKRVLDRAIGVSLPFFIYRGGGVHHSLRYGNKPKLRICFYDARTEFERDTAVRLAEANRINLGFSELQVSIAADVEHIAEEIRL